MTIDLADGQYALAGFWLIFAVVAVGALGVASFLLRPRPPKTKPEEFRELETPDSAAGETIMLVEGTVTVPLRHCLWWGEKNAYAYKVKA